MLLQRLYFILSYSIVYVYYIFLYPVIVHGYLGCFLILAIVNSAAMNIWGACICLKYSFILIYAQEWDCSVIW